VGFGGSSKELPRVCTIPSLGFGVEKNLEEEKKGVCSKPTLCLLEPILRLSVNFSDAQSLENQGVAQRE